MGISVGTIGAGATIDSPLLNSNFTTVVAEANRLAGYLPTGAAAGVATSGNTPGTLVQRDATTNTFQVAGIGMIPLLANPGLNVNAGTTYVGNWFAYSKSGVAGGAFGNADGTISANGFIGPLTGNVAGNVTGNVTGNVSGSAGTAAALTNPVLLTGLIADYKPTATVANTINIAAGGSWRDINGTVIPGAVAATYALPTQPTNPHFQYIGLSMAPGSGALTATVGALDVAESALVIPPANKPITSFRWDSTAPGGVIPAALIRDLRFSDAGGSSGGAGGGAPTTPVYWVDGTPPGTIPNAVDSTIVQAATFMHPDNVHKSGDAPPANLVRGLIQLDTPSAGRFIVGTTTVTIIASALNPWSVDIGGVRRTATSSVVGTCSLAANQQVGLYADVTNAGPPQLAFIAAGGSVSTTQQWLCNFWWNGTTLVPTTPPGATAWTKDFKPLFSAQSPQIQAVCVPMVDNGVAFVTGATAGAGGTDNRTNGANQVVTTVPSVAFTAIDNCRGWFDMNVLVQSFTFAVGIVYLLPIIDGGAVSFAGPYADPLQATVAPKILHWRVHVPFLAKGPHTFQLAYFGQAAGTSTMTLAASGVNCTFVVMGV